MENKPNKHLIVRKDVVREKALAAARHVADTFKWRVWYREEALVDGVFIVTLKKI